MPKLPPRLVAYLLAVAGLLSAQGVLASDNEPFSEPQPAVAAVIRPIDRLMDQLQAASDESGASAPSDRLSARASDLVMRALSLVGVNYRFGGSKPETGLDCSGMVRYVYQSFVRTALPRRSEEISRVGATIPKDALQPGDLVFYKTVRRAFSHVGIYLGEGRFVHAPSTGGQVRVESMNQPYWIARFSGARRIEE